MATPTTTAPSPGTDLLGGGSTTPTTTPAANPATPSSTSTFPGSTTATANGLPAPPQMSVAAFTAFASQHGVSSTEMANYIDTTTGSLTGWATEFLNYYQSNSESRQAIQDQLVDADLLAESAANGSISSTTNTAFNTAMSTAVKQGVPLNQYLSAAAGPGQIQQLIAKQASAAETMQSHSNADELHLHRPEHARCEPCICIRGSGWSCAHGSRVGHLCLQLSRCGSLRRSGLQAVLCSYCER